MNRIFQPRNYIKVPDETLVSPFLTTTDTTQNDLPLGALAEMSIASGRIDRKTHSWVHVHPVVTQVTYLISGMLRVRMQDEGHRKPYTLALNPGQAVVVEPGTLFQLRNDSDEVAEVLYIVSPSYIYEKEGEELRYDDAVLVARTWEELEVASCDVRRLQSEARALREESVRRLAKRQESGRSSI
jgi:mannose-6-phosphate isomerase-like protein (cupin superfamily)